MSTKFDNLESVKKRKFITIRVIYVIYFLHQYLVGEMVSFYFELPDT